MNYLLNNYFNKIYQLAITENNENNHDPSVNGAVE